jgi:hypothetical protein
VRCSDDNHARSPTETAGEAHRYSDISPTPAPILELWLERTGQEAQKGNHDSKIAEGDPVAGVTGLIP